MKPPPGGRHFVILFGPAATSDEKERAVGPDQMGKWLARAQGYLRSELAATLNLKRMPELSFVPEPQKGDKSN